MMHNNFMEKYDFKKIEKKWQRRWLKEKIYQAKNFSKKPKYYCLIEFPYPSGEGLHVGHTRSYTAMDVIARKRRTEGYNVLFPIGWDAFGLPTENYAIKTGIHPKIATKKNTDTFRRQLKSLGFSFDWSREINTTNPKYYKWTQWIFLQLYKHNLAYKKKILINWCPSCKIGLANEEVIDGKCERCGAPTEKKEKEQWLLKITKYADRLLKDLNNVDYLEKIKIQQQNWIGRSEGASINFQVSKSNFQIKVFTTRPDTIFGATYLVLAPEHEFVQEQIRNPKSEIRNKPEIQKYINEAKKKSELQRTDLAKEKTGVELKGIKAINPATKKEIPIWVADYVLSGYGTGAIMAVPAHDERDLNFAEIKHIDIQHVIDPGPGNAKKEYYFSIFGHDEQKIGSAVEWDYAKARKGEKVPFAYSGPGILINSGQFNGKDSEEAKWEITKFVGGKKQVQYHLRDWVFSRQHYWGEPIPMVYCKKHGWQPVPEKDLPVKLPEVKRYQPTDTGESPLANIKNWVNTKCPICKGPAKRETDTMPNWAGSSWYFLAYVMKAMKYWMPVDWYNGGMEHTTLHLLYSRFWNKFLYDIGFAPTSEPYKKRTSHGMILGQDGEKMSKSRGNVINPDDIVRNYGADAYRIYQMFMGPFDQAIPWDPRGIEGAKRFLERTWDYLFKNYTGVFINNKDRLEWINGNRQGVTTPKIEILLNKTIKKVGEDIESMKFNTAISQLMILRNSFYEYETEQSILSKSKLFVIKGQCIKKSDFEKFLIILSPFAPHLTEEIWRKGLKHKKSIFLEKWPEYDSKKTREEFFELVVQINGKMRDKFEAPRGISQESAQELTLTRENVKKHIGAKNVKKTIFVPDRLINVII